MAGQSVVLHPKKRVKNLKSCPTVSLPCRWIALTRAPRHDLAKSFSCSNIFCTDIRSNVERNFRKCFEKTGIDVVCKS